MSKEICITKLSDLDATTLRFQCGHCRTYYIADDNEMTPCDKCGRYPVLKCPNCDSMYQISVGFDNIILYTP